jgi:DNA polymerase-1
MSVLNRAREVYRRGRAEGGERAASTPPPAWGYARNAIDAKSQEPCETAASGSDDPDAKSTATPDRAADYVPVRDRGGLLTVLQALDETEAVGLDTETTGLDPRRDRVRLLQLATDRGLYLVDCFATDPRPLFDLLSEKTVVAHNAVFDLAFLGALCFEPGAVRDTMVASQLLDGIRRPKGYHGLAETAERFLGATLDKGEQRGDWTGDLTASQLDYAVRDAAVLVPLHRALEAKIAASGQETVADVEHRCLPAVAWLSRSGVPFDRTTWDRLAEEAAAEADRLADCLDADAPRDSGCLLVEGAVNWSSPQQVVRVFERLGIALANCDDDALATVDHPLAALLRDHRSATKLATTYGKAWAKGAYHDGRLYPAWKRIGADSGRMACSAPNLQNLPRDPRYRACFRAPEGRVLVKADYSQIELRIAARISGDAAMAAAYRRGEDLHARTARSVLGIAEVTKEHRQLAKALNFGLLYGMGAARFRDHARNNYGVDLSLEQAKAYRAAFFRSYPGLAAWHRRVGLSDAPIDTRTLTGRRRAGVTRFTEKLNTPVQGTGADGLKAALALLWERRSECPGAVPVLVVHDEIVIECDEAQAEAALAWLKQAMLDGMAPLIDPVPVEVEVKVGRTWGGE